MGSGRLAVVSLYLAVQWPAGWVKRDSHVGVYIDAKYKKAAFIYSRPRVVSVFVMLCYLPLSFLT